MKKLIQIISKLSLLVLLVSSASLVKVSAADREAISVGILQFNDHNSLNANREGFIAGLLEAGYVEGENLTINYINAGADVSNLNSMAESLVNNNDYFFAIATPAAQALANATKDKAVFFSSVADPIGAGVVESMEEPGANLTGTTNIGPIKEQIDILYGLVPDAEKIGLIYNSSEVNAIYQVGIAKEVLEGLGLEVVEGTITSTNDISQVFGALVEEVDGVYLVTDNYIASAMALVGDIGKEAQLALVGGSNDMIEENGLATYGLDYYKLGVQTAKMLIDHIDNGTEIATMPVQYAEELELIVNEDYANAIGIDPASITLDLIQD